MKRSKSVVARLHALWTLEGLQVIDRVAIRLALKDRDPRIRAAGVRVAEAARPSIRRRVLKLLSDPAPEVQMQLALTLADEKEQLKKLETKSPSMLARQLAAFSLGKVESKTRTTTKNIAQATPLSAEQQKLFENGKAVYEATCLPCHQPHGLGQEGLAPPLVDTEWVAGSPERLARIILHGMRGPIHVKNQLYELDMPSLGVLDDEQIASVLTYVRREWGHKFDPIDTAFVKKVRAATIDREDAWTEPELLKIP